MSDYPVGARWGSISKNGSRAGIHLESRTNIEVWKWGVCHSDGSGHKSDWGTSRSFVANEAKIAGCDYDTCANWPRFKRIK